MQATYYGQSCFLVDIDGTKILFDPFISGNPQASDIDISTIKPDFILVSHGHGDHIGDLVNIAKQSDATVIAIHEIAEWLGKQGVDNIIGMNLGGNFAMPFGKIQMVPAWHSSSLPDGTYAGTPAGFIVTHDKGAFYYSGDTALFQEMKLFGRRQKIDLAFLCMGDHYTMDMVDAVAAAEFVGTDRVVGMHFDTFPPIAINHDEAFALFEKAGKKLTLPKIGDTFGL